MGIVAVLALAVIGYGSWRALAPSGAAPTASAETAVVASERPVIVVLPFENLGEADDEYFSDGMTEG